MKQHATVPDVESTESITAPSPASLLDSRLHAAAARFTMGLSPIAMGLSLVDWGLHLAAAPGRQMELGNLALQHACELGQQWSQAWINQTQSAIGGETDAALPDNQWQESMNKVQNWWQQATRVRGVSPHHQQMNEFMLRQMFAMLEPANWPWSHPETIKTAIATGGQSLLQGGENLLHDLRQKAGFGVHEEVNQYRVGENIAVTPGHVVYRNHLVELIQYTPQTKKVHPEPVFIVPSWIMKYYILDLSPHNSMVNYLVQQGHTVFILSWHNPDENDRMLGLNDYLQQGIFDVLVEINKLCKQAPVHTVGYCLGGTLLAIAMAALSRLERVTGFEAMAPVKSMTLLAAQTDFSEPGEMGVLIDDSQVQMIEDLMAEQGYMSGAQMAGSFQFLNSRDLVWNKRLREYLLGVRDS
ncbi:MAG: putative poly-beta-hydroxybutyrate polymerase PhbC, partial [Pseudomonadota bacterium]